MTSTHPRVADDGLGRAGRPLAAPRRPAFKQAIPHAKLAVIPDAGHVSNLEQPALFNEAVREFCRAQSSRV